jgi:hypothetical protein
MVKDLSKTEKLPYNATGTYFFTIKYLLSFRLLLFAEATM